MKIPEKVKIGGKTYTVKITNDISLGRVSYSAEIDYLNLEIRIQPSAKEKMEADFLHEVTHGIFDFLGYKEHDEKHIDELAQSLYAVIQDNPEIFSSGGNTANDDETTIETELDSDGFKPGSDKMQKAISDTLEALDKLSEGMKHTRYLYSSLTQKENVTNEAE